MSFNIDFFYLFDLHLNVDFLLLLLGGEFNVKRSSNDYDKFGDEDDPKKEWKNKKKGKKVFKKSDEAESDWGLLSGASITGKLPRYVNRVTLKVT
jgi:hypothetical protein